MTNLTAVSAPAPHARLTGALYLISGAFAGFSLQFFQVLTRDVASAPKNILASEALVRFAIVSDIIGQVGYIVVALMLFHLLAAVNRPMAWLMVIFWAVEVPIDLLNNLNQFGILYLIHSPAGMTTDQANGLIPLLLNLHVYGLSYAAVFFGLWLLPMGYLVFRSGFLPRIIGVLLIIACVGYVAQSIVDILSPNSGINIYLFTSWGELVFSLWLVIRGVDGERWQKRIRAVV